MSFAYFYTEVFSCGSTLWPWVAGLAINSTLLLAGIALLGPLAGRRNPALRHATATLGLACLVLLPAISLTLAGGWKVTRPLAIPSISSGFTGLLDPPPTGRGFAGAPACLAIWMTGSGLILLRLTVDLVIPEWHARRSAPAPGSWHRLARRLGARFGLRRPIRVLRTVAVDIPCTWGCLRPVVLLPERAARWGGDRLTTVLLHELAHIRRRDGLLRFLSRFACALFWFHPLAWWIEGAARDDAERCCDRLAVEAGIPAGRYASHMLQIVRDARRPAQAIAPPMAEGSHLGRRIAALLDPRPAPTHAGRLPIVMIAITLVGATLLLGAASAPAISARVQPDAEFGCPGLASEPEPTVENLLQELRAADSKLITSDNAR